jgi:hypothetical protein
MNKATMRAGLAFLALCAAAACATAPAAQNQPEPQWRSLFNGENLDGWTPKFVGHPLGENLLDTFRVENGLLVVSYDNYDALEGRFGHLFYAEPYSHYIIRAEYRFVGEQVAGGPDWALRNNGLMLHAQPPETMAIDQEFPVSIEVQLLGGDGQSPRTTANMCSPGSSIVINGARDHTHCIISDSQTYLDNEWVTVEIEVRGDNFRHFVNGVQVMTYTDALMDEPAPWSPTLELSSGYIAIQAESAPTEFRRIEIMELDAGDGN